MQAAAASMHVKKNSEMREVYGYYMLYIYISLAYYVYCTLFWCVYKKKSCHSPVHPKEKKNPLLKGGTIDHPLRKRVVPPEPIEATDMTVMRDNKEWKTKEDVVLKKD